MIDVHTHILPYIDDGAADTAEAIEILKNGSYEGIKTFLLTPHIKSDSDWDKINQIEEIFVVLNKTCVKKRLGVKLILGAEIAITPDLPEKLKDNTVITINGKYVLIELPFSQLPIYTEDVLFRLLMKDFIPIITHPERYLYLRGKLEIIKQWVENGVMIQINTGSLAGIYGMRVKRLAKNLLKNGLVHLLGSDVHSDGKEGYGFKRAAEILKKIVGNESAHKILIDYPELIIKV